MTIIYISIIIMMIYNIIKSKKAMHMLQQNLYNENNRYYKWILKNIKTVFPILDILIVLLMITNYFINNNILLIFNLLLMILSCYLIKTREKAEQVKKPLVITARVKRLIVTISILFLIPIVLLITNIIDKEIVLLVLAIMVFMNYFVIGFAKYLNRPVEKCVYYHFYNMATKKLYNLNTKVIGITGSYGKTSSKNILSDILNVKYIAKPTPRNLNTEYGLMNSINNHLDKFDQFFIAEMGAYKRGEIKTLCDMVKPKYGILTKIGTAHLETFGSQENIQKTKFELIESLPDTGVAILNKDDELQRTYNIKSKCKKIWIGINETDADVVATNIKCNSKGSSFDIIFKKDKNKYRFETKLLGNNNIYNILASVALGHELGMTIEELIVGVNKVKPVEHRLELKKIANFYMMDDAYNSNPVGAKSALDVLNMMDGEKIVVTPGMIELGEKQEEYNQEFGRQIADVADLVILVGEKITKPIYNGLMDKKYSKDNIIIINDVKEAYKIIGAINTKKEIYALFENDLPDSYNE